MPPSGTCAQARKHCTKPPHYRPQKPFLPQVKYRRRALDAPGTFSKMRFSSRALRSARFRENRSVTSRTPGITSGIRFTTVRSITLHQLGDPDRVRRDRRDRPPHSDRPTRLDPTRLDSIEEAGAVVVTVREARRRLHLAHLRRDDDDDTHGTPSSGVSTFTTRT